MSKGRNQFPERSQRFLDEDDDDDGFNPQDRGGKKQAPAFESTDPLWLTYGINPALPFRTKVEKLMVGWEMDADAIAKILEEDDSERTERTISEIREGWVRLGSSLTDEAREIERGRMISELNDLKRQAEVLNTQSPDYKHLQLQVSITERIAKLRGIEVDKKDTSKDDEAADPVEHAINSLSPERLKDLMGRLNDKTPSASE